MTRSHIKLRSLRCNSIVCLAAVFCIASRVEANEAGVAGLHRLYDMTPVSATNPVAASVEDCGIEIPVSELRAYVAATPDTMPPLDGSVRPPLTLEQKQATLERLLDEHFLMWAGYQEKAEQTPGIVHMLGVTEAMLLRETLMMQAVGKMKSRVEYQENYKKVLDRIFNETDITVSTWAYDELKADLKLVQPAAGTTLAATTIFRATPVARNSVFARCNAGFVTIGDVLDCYARIPPGFRPDLETQEGVNSILEQMFGNSLLTGEARRQGLDKASTVVEKLQLNCNMFVRLYVLNQIAAESVARSEEPGKEARVRQWYWDHVQERYTFKDGAGKEQIISFEQQHERIENDYVDDLRGQIREEHILAMRKNHKIKIDQKLLKETRL